MPTRLESFPHPPHGVDHIGITVGRINNSRYPCTKLRTTNPSTLLHPHNRRPALQYLLEELQLRRSFFPPLPPLASGMIHSPRDLRRRSVKPISWSHLSTTECSTKTRGGGMTAFRRTIPPPHRHRKPPPLPTELGSRPTPAVRLQTRVRGRGRMTSGTLFRWSIMITPPLNPSLSHSRPVTSLPRTDNRSSR